MAPTISLTFFLIVATLSARVFLFVVVRFLQKWSQDFGLLVCGCKNFIDGGGRYFTSKLAPLLQSLITDSLVIRNYYVREV